MTSLSAGTVFAGDYRVVRPLSAGGMGMVYVAHQVSTGRERALKIMLGELAQNPDLKRRFAQEARIGAEIDSEHVVEVVGAGVDAESGVPWLAMELLQGQDLAGYLQQTGPVPPLVVLELFEQLAHALGAAHDKQIVHRDLKPENLFLAKARRAGGQFTLKVLDFGIAKLMNQVRTSATGAMGTPLWMAPEQAQSGTNVTPAADVWAMGLIAFRALTGRSFWKSASDANASAVMVLREMVIEPIPPATQRARELATAQVPAAFDAWFARCVDRDPRRRFQHARDAFQELRAILGPAPQPVQPATFAAQPLPNPTVAAQPLTVSRTATPAVIPLAPMSSRPANKRTGLYASIGLGLAAIVVLVVVMVTVGGDKKKKSRQDGDETTAASPSKPANRFITKLRAGSPKTLAGVGHTIELTDDYQIEPSGTIVYFERKATDYSVLIYMRAVDKTTLAEAQKKVSGEPGTTLLPGAKGDADGFFFAYTSSNGTAVRVGRNYENDGVLCEAVFFDGTADDAGKQEREQIVDWLASRCRSMKRTDVAVTSSSSVPDAGSAAPDAGSAAPQAASAAPITSARASARPVAQSARPARPTSDDDLQNPYR